MKAFALLGGLFLFPLFASAQIEVSVFAGPSYSFYDAPDSQRESSILIEQTDEGYYRQDGARVYSHEVTNDLGVDAGLNVKFGIYKSWSLTTGLTVNYRTFKHDPTFKFSYVNPNSVPEFTPRSPLSTSSSPCDAFNITENFDTKKQGKHDILYLGIPVLLEYALLPGKLHLVGGGQLLTPTFSTRIERGFDYSEFTATNTSSGESVTTCNYTTFTERNHSGSSLNNLQVQLRAGILWEVTNKIALEGAFARGITNLFVAPEYQDFSYYNAEVFFQTASILVRYRL